MLLMSQYNNPEGDKPLGGDPRFPGVGTWRKKLYSDEELAAREETHKAKGAVQFPAEITDVSKSTEQRLHATGVRGRISLRELREKMRARSTIASSERAGEKDQKFESIKPLVVSIGKEFHPYALPQEPYGGLTPDDLRFYRHPRAATVTLHTEVLPDLDFQIVTIPPEVEAGKSEIVVESSIRQALQLGLLHKTGREALVYSSWQPYGFNEDVLPLVQRLRFSFIDSESQSEAKPEIRRTGQVQFKFTATEDEMTPDLRGRFDLAGEHLVKL